MNEQKITDWVSSAYEAEIAKPKLASWAPSGGYWPAAIIAMDVDGYTLMAGAADEKMICWIGQGKELVAKVIKDDGKWWIEHLDSPIVIGDVKLKAAKQRKYLLKMMRDFYGYKG